MSFDISIKNGKIIDGTGNPLFKGDIGIIDDTIKKIKHRITEDGIIEIDASGMIVCPGFIDMHSHTDFYLPMYSKMDAAIHQGITTAVVGMCGEGLAPIPSDKLDLFKELFKPPMGGEIKITWNSYKEYLDAMDSKRIPVNLSFAVGFSTIRIAGGPGFENRPPTNDELEQMKNYVAEAMKAGAFGMSTGLIYAPQVYATTEEIIELVKMVAEYNGLYFSHIRGEANTLIKAVKEFIEIVEKSGCVGGQISHHKASGKDYWGSSKETLRLIEEANNRGISITFDQYPYNRGQSNLASTLPAWAREGGKEKILERMKDNKIREQIKSDLQKESTEWENWIKINGFEHLYITFFKKKEWKEFEGLSVAEISKKMGDDDVYTTFFDILLEEDTDIPITIESMDEEDIRRIMKSPYQMFGTDSVAMSLLPKFKIFHPRTFGTFPKVLEKYVHEEKLLTIENAIRKMTSFPAQRLGLRNRGLLMQGMKADIVIFDPMKIHDKTTYEEPHQFPEGIPFVIVNGVITIDHSKQQRKYPGRVLRHSK